MKNPLQLPSSTIVDRPLPKAQLYKKFELKQPQRDAIDADIARLDFVNKIASQTRRCRRYGGKSNICG